MSNYRLIVIKGGSNHASIANESGSTSLRDDVSLTTLFKMKLIPEHLLRHLLHFTIKGNPSNISTTAVPANPERDKLNMKHGLVPSANTPVTYLGSPVTGYSNDLFLFFSPHLLHTNNKRRTIPSKLLYKSMKLKQCC
jgi:hypothetical protein